MHALAKSKAGGRSKTKSFHSKKGIGSRLNRKIAEYHLLNADQMKYIKYLMHVSIRDQSRSGPRPGNMQSKKVNSQAKSRWQVKPSHFIESDMFESGRYAECHLLKVGERRST